MSHCKDGKLKTRKPIGHKAFILAALTVLLSSVSVQAQFVRVQNRHFDPNAPSNSVRVAQGHSQHPFANKTAFSNVKTVATNLRGFGVPFKISADNEAFIEVQLYLSRDMGQTWSFEARQSTDKEEFPFQADGDGEYWFALKTLNRDRKLLPEGDPTPELKIVVDSVQPKLDFRVKTDAAGRVVCRWRAEDKNLSPESLQIFYQAINAMGPKPWQKVPVNLNGTARSGVYADQLAWWPDTTDQSIKVAVQIADIAGNKIQLERQVVVPRSNWRSRPQSTAQIPSGNRSNQKSGAFEAGSGGAWPQPDQIRVQPEAMPNQQPKNSFNEKTAGHPPGHKLECKDGVCTLVPLPDVAGPGVTVNRIPKTKPETQSKAPSNKPQPRMATHQPFSNQSLANPPMQLIGSEIEYAAPPVPNGYVAPVIAENQAPKPTGNRGVLWESQTEKWVPKNQTSFSSTVRSDPSITPIPYPEKPAPRRVTDVPSNPSKMSVVGNQVVGESSTMGATNQYRGLNTQGNRPIPSPMLLPNVGAGQAEVTGEFVGEIQQPNNQAKTNGGVWNTTKPPSGFQSNTQNPMMSSGFANRQMAPIDRRQSPQNHALQNQQTRTPRASAQRVSTGASTGQGRITKAPTQIIGSKRFRLSYGIDSIDPSGVAGVDLWMTRDEGRTWNSWGSDPDNSSPFPVEVQEEGHYGFRIVVHSKDGLTGQGPSSGDDADMWVLIDTQAPLTRITSVPYGRGEEAGRLVINYSVSDKHITLRPITLSFSANPDGPWTPIETGVRNESRFVWKVKTDVPDRIFLRIEAVDKAGNLGVHVLSQAIDVSGLVPRGTIHAVSPVGIKRN